MNTLKRELTHLGLTDKEAQVYIAALQLGPSPVQDISKEAKVNRATTYVMIESLEKRGLVSSTQKGKKRLFIAEAPDRLMTLVRMQKRELEEKENEISKLLPKLNAIFNRSGEKPEIRYMEGAEGLESLRREFEDLKGDTLQIVGYDALVKVVDFEATLEHRRKLKKKKMPGRVIYVTEQTREQIQDLLLVDMNFKIVSPKRFPFRVEGEVTVRQDHVMLFTYAQGPLAVNIRSSVLADTFRAMFELAWKGV